MTTWRPLGLPSFSRTMRLSPSRTLVQITCRGPGEGMCGGEVGWAGGGTVDFQPRQQQPPAAILSHACSA